MDDTRHYYNQSKVVRRLDDFYSCDEDERRSGARPWVSTSDSDTSDSNHKSSPIPVPLRHSTHKGGYCSDSSPCKNLPPIGVFWDIENCQIPRGRSAVAVAQAIRDKFFDGYREAEFLVVCDVKKETSIIIQELNDAQVNLIHVGSQSKNAADEKLRQSIRRFADLHGSLAAIVLISGDINFAPDLCDLRHRKKIRVILVHNDVCSESLILCANEHFRFSELVASLPLRGTVKSVHPAEVTVSALPVSWEPNRVRQKLKRLAENSGGKVGMVMGDLATIRFPSVESATRAQKRMDGERVFGSQITVGNPVVIQEHRFNKEMSPQKGHYRRVNVRREEDTTTWVSQPVIFNNTGNNGRSSGFKPGSQVLPFNQENVPLPVPEPLWKSGCNFHIQPFATKTPQVTVETNPGRPILGRRNEPNNQHNFNGKNQSGRHSLDSMLDWGEFNGDTKLSRPPSLDNWAANFAQDEPENLLGVDFTMPPPPIVNLPRKENQYLFHPIAVKSEALPTQAVDLLVTNLDENIALTDLKNLLFVVFDQHCTVLNVSVFRQSDGLLAAHVKVRSQQDAVQAMSALQRRKIGITQIHITTSAAVMSNGHDRSPSSASSCSDAGVPESRPSTRHNDQSRVQTALPSVMIHLKDLAARLRVLVNRHDNRLPLTKLMKSYTAQFEPLLRDTRGVPLEHLVTCVPGLELVESAGSQYLCPTSVSSQSDSEAQAGNARIQPLLRQLTQELKELLKTQPQCCMLFSRLSPAYRRHFGRSLKLADFGCDKLIDLLKLLSRSLQVIRGEGNKKVVTMSHSTQTRRFTADLLRVLRVQSNKQAVLCDLPVLWETVMGKRLQASDYGLCYVDDLLELMPSSVLVSGFGVKSTVSVNPKEQTEEERERTRLFASEVVDVLSQQPDFTADFRRFIPLYHHKFGKQLRVADFGFVKLIELFDVIPHIAKVETEEGEAGPTVSLTLSERLNVLSKQLLGLMKSRQPACLPLNTINSTYLWSFGMPLRPASYKCRTIDELVAKLPTLQVVSAEDGSRVIVPEDRADSRILCLRVLRILWERSGAKTTVTDLEAAFLHYYKEPCTRHTLETRLKDIVLVTEDGVVRLTRLQLFACDVYRLLCASDGCMALSVFEATVSPGTYGYTSVSELLTAIDHVVTVSINGQKTDLILNAQLADVGIYLPPELSKNGHQSAVTPKTEVPIYPPSSKMLLNGSNSKADNNKTPSSVASNSGWKCRQPNSTLNDSIDSRKTVNTKKTFKIKAEASERPGLVLLSPAEFLRPSCALAFLPSSPDPSALPKPGDFNLTQEKNGFNQLNVHSPEEADNNDPNRRRLRLAAHFASGLQLK